MSGSPELPDVGLEFLNRDPTPKERRDRRIEELQLPYDVVRPEKPVHDITRPPPQSNWTSSVTRAAFDNLGEAQNAVQRTKQGLVLAGVIGMDLTAPLDEQPTVYELSDGPLASWGKGKRDLEKFPLEVKPTVPMTGYRHSTAVGAGLDNDLAFKWRCVAFGEKFQ